MNWSYLAGFIDADGCIKVYGGSPRITIGQKHREVLDAIQVFIDTKNAITLSRNCHYLQINSRWDVEYVIKGILPHLIVKRVDALAALKAFEDRDRHKVLADERGV